MSVFCSRTRPPRNRTVSRARAWPKSDIIVSVTRTMSATKVTSAAMLTCKYFMATVSRVTSAPSTATVWLVTGSIMGA